MKIVLGIVCALIAAALGFVLIWAFAFGLFDVPLTTSGVDGVFPIAVFFDCVLGAASFYWMHRRKWNKN